MTCILAVSNQKGGVAKTTTTLSLGACLTELGHKTLVVDLDSQANLTLAAGLNADTLADTIADLLTAPDNTCIPDGVIQNTVLPNLDILPADLRIASAERSLYNQPGYEFTLQKILQPLQASYQYILLDCPPSLGAITIMALTAARHVIVPVQCEYYAARGLSRLLDIVAAVKEHTNPGLHWHLLATLYDQRNAICRTVLQQLQQHFSETIFNTVIGIDTQLRECPIVGEPITVYAPRTRAAEQYRKLARELDAKINH